MNDHSNSLPPAGDDALQARIVAWVLGEASPFEAAELEKLCAENPRLRDFERRTRDLHELLVADAKPGLHPTWQLPPDKRGKITDLLGPDIKVMQPAYSSEKVNRYFSRRILLAAAACLALSIITFPVFMSRMERKVSVAASAPEKTVDFMPASGGGGGVERASQRQPESKRSLAIKPSSRAAAEGASTSYAIPDSEPLMPDLASAHSGGLGRSEGGVGNGPQGPGAPPAKSASRPASASAVSPEQQKLKKQLAQLKDSEETLAESSGVAADRLRVAENAPAPATSAPAAPPLPAPMATPAAATALPEAEMELPKLATGIGGGGGIAAGFGSSSGGRAGGGFGGGAGAGGLGGAAGSDDFGSVADASKTGKDSLAGGVPGAWKSWSERDPNNHDFVTPTVEDIVTGGLRSGDGAVNRNNIDAILNNPNNPVPGGVPVSPRGTPMPAEPSIATKGDAKLAAAAEDKPVDASGAAASSLAKTPATEGDKEYFTRETARRQAGAKGQAAVEYKDGDLAWTAADEATKSRAFSTADGLERGREADRAKEVGEVTSARKKSQEDVAGLALSDEFGEAAGKAEAGEKGMKQEQAAPLAGERSPLSSARGGLSTDLSSLTPNNTEAAFQYGLNFTGSATAYPYRYVVPPIEDPRVRPQGGMPTDQDDDGSKLDSFYGDATHYGLVAGRGLQIDGATGASGTDSALWSKPFGDLQAGQADVGGEVRFRSALDAEPEGFGNTHSFSLDSLGALDARRGDITLDYNSAANANNHYTWQVTPPGIAGKPWSGTTAWFDTDGTEGTPAAGALFGRESQPQVVPPVTAEAPAQQMAQTAKDGLAADASDAHTETVDQVRRSLYLAEGAYNLGKYDDAVKQYEDAIRVDPYNKAARRGLEQVAQARSDYYRAAYDHTRAELLAQVDKSWELSVPPVAVPADKELKDTKAGAVDGDETRAKLARLAEGEELLARDAAAKAKEIVIPQFKTEEGKLGDVLDTLRQKAMESDAAAPAMQKGLSLAVRKGAEGVDVEDLQVPPMDLKNASVSDVLEKITESTGLDLEAKGQFLTLKPGLRTKGKQAEQIVDKMAEVATATEPFSTFSLHVSDASFKLAKAALDRGEQPAAESIRPEEFYNAFDYGDPAPANGEPVVCATEQCAHPAIPQRNLMRVAVRTAAAGRGSSTPLNLTLLLDSSGSMEREDRQAAMTKAVSQLAGLLKEGDTITVAGFARQPRLLADRLPGARAQELNGIIAQTPSEGGTNLEEGIKLAEELAKRQFNPAAQNRIVLFTDGAANLGDARPEALKARVEQLRQQGIAFDAAGFGADGLNDRLLEQLTRNGNGRYYIVDRPEDAGTGFAKQLAGAFRPAAENVKVQVRFNPARVARYKLIGFEEHRLNKEDFRNDAVDAAEMAAEEAGVALYQIEPLPGGEGELGDVSVRFRDAASGQMVERTWTMPYEPQASAFDQAPPSIQLAGMAAFAAEKLRKAPLSDALDFKQLGKVFPAVKAKYPDSQAVSDLGGMIEKLK